MSNVYFAYSIKSDYHRPAPPRRKKSRACDACAVRKTRCDDARPCRHCINNRLECTEKRQRKKSGPKTLRHKTLASINSVAGGRDSWSPALDFLRTPQSTPVPFAVASFGPRAAQLLAEPPSAPARLAVASYALLLAETHARASARLLEAAPNLNPQGEKDGLKIRHDDLQTHSVHLHNADSVELSQDPKNRNGFSLQDSFNHADTFNSGNPENYQSQIAGIRSEINANADVYSASEHKSPSYFSVPVSRSSSSADSRSSPADMSMLVALVGDAYSLCALDNLGELSDEALYLLSCAELHMFGVHSLRRARPRLAHLRAAISHAQALAPPFDSRAAELRCALYVCERHALIFDGSLFNSALVSGGALVSVPLPLPPQIHPVSFAYARMLSALDLLGLAELASMISPNFVSLSPNPMSPNPISPNPMSPNALPSNPSVAPNLISPLHSSNFFAPDAVDPLRWEWRPSLLPQHIKYTVARARLDESVFSGAHPVAHLLHQVLAGRVLLRFSGEVARTFFAHELLAVMASVVTILAPNNQNDSAEGPLLGAAVALFALVPQFLAFLRAYLLVAPEQLAPEAVDILLGISKTVSMYMAPEWHRILLEPTLHEWFAQLVGPDDVLFLDGMAE